MKFILYTSVLNQPQYDALAVPKIVRNARLKNSLQGITGILLFDGLNFTQYLEGDTSAVDTLMSNILSDDRHKNIVIVAAGYQKGRLYNNWGMGYVDIAEHELKIESCIKTHDFSLDTFKRTISNFYI